MKHLSLKTIAPLTVLLLSAVSTQALADFEKSYDGIKDIRIDVSSGNVTINKSLNQQVTLTLEGNSKSRYESLIEVEGSKLIIDGENFRHNRRGYRGRADWVISVPDGINVRFSTGSGDLDVQDANVNLKMNTGSGRITLDNASGEYDANTGSGRIEITNSNGIFDLNTGSGNIQTQNVTFGHRSSLNTGSGDVEGEGVKLSGAASFNTGSGDAEILLAEANMFDLSVNSGSGNATLNLDGNSLKGVLVMSHSGRRGEIDAPFEFDTTEEIDNGRRSHPTIEKTKEFDKADIITEVSTGSGTAKITK